MKEKEKKQYTHIIHPFPPLYDSESEILILGSFPSVKSREQKFFYGHKQNRFWKVMAAVLETAVPETIEEKKKMLYRHHIALWDSIYSCDIIGSSDSSIKNAVPNDFSFILKTAPIRQIYTNGGTAYKLYHKYCEKVTGFEAVKLPSTSPANCRVSYEELYEAYSVIQAYIR